MAITFPSSPAVGDVFPAGAGTSGVSQWKWDGSKWDVVSPFLRTNNQQAYNSYVWPSDKAPNPGYQITDLLANGTLQWDLPGGSFIYLDDISSQFNGTTNIFTLTENGQPLTLSAGENVIIVLGGIVQTPGTSYTISGPQITFSLAPAPGASFVAISNFGN